MACRAASAGTHGRVAGAALLSQTGLQNMPVVAGERITDEAAELARAMRVWQVLDGRVTAPISHGH